MTFLKMFWKFNSLSSSEMPALEGGVEDSMREDSQSFEDDEAWELEDGPPKLSVSFQKTGNKLRSAKTRAAAKMATITVV